MQLKFSDDFNYIIEDFKIWKNEENIPINIKIYIKKTSDIVTLYAKDTNNFYCAKCLKQLDKNNYCKTCNISHNNLKNNIKNINKEDLEEFQKDLKIVDTIKDCYGNYCNYSCYYYVFDKTDENIFLYLLKENITYNNPFKIESCKQSSININNVYLIKKDKILDLFTNTYYKYEAMDYNDELKNSDNIDEKKFNEYMNTLDFLYTEVNAFLYIDNLYILNDSIYKYTTFIENASYLTAKKKISLAQLSYLPIYCKAFEYLSKLKLYNLAFNSADVFKKGKNFKEIFKIEKNHLPFMRNNDISHETLIALQLCQTEDKDLLNFLESQILTATDIVKEFKIDAKKLKNYFDKLNLDETYLNEYYDYLKMAKDLGLDLKDKSILYPKNLLLEHDKLYLQIESSKDPNIDEKIKNLSNITALNYYEDENYIIFPANSISCLIDESNQQHNCVSTYCQKLANNNCQIYFLRKKGDKNKSLVTIEVKNNQVIQAREKFNKNISDEYKKIIDKWKKNLLPIINN